METPPDQLATTLGLIAGRRTNLRIDLDRTVPGELIERLCEAGTWAPNHKLTEPWRFAVLTGRARALLGDILAGDLADRGIDEPARLDKARTKYLRAPVIVVVGCAPDADPIRHTENRDAVAAAVQNVLLTATAAGLASYWATGAAARLPETKRLCGFSTDTEIVALIYLGWPTGEAAAPARTEPSINWVAETFPSQ